ncbi:MAG: hypothetical protein PHH58_07095 [Rhodoferax sp.]|nr:hypothetical protein [Rhodoferax sp.]
MNTYHGFVTKLWFAAAAAFLGLIGSSLAQSPNWAQVTGPGTPGYGGLVRFAQGTPDGTAWIMTEGGGVHKSASGTGVWAASNNGLTNLSVKSGVINTAVTPYSTYAGTYGGGVFKSLDAGANWGPINNGLGCTYVTALTGLTSRLLAGTDCQSASGVYFADVGQAWTLASGLPTNVRVNSINKITRTSSGVDFLLAATNQGLYKSLDSGSSWTALPTSPSGPNGAVVYNVRALFYTPTGATTEVTRLLATVEGAGVFISEDGGVNWTASNSGLPANPVPAAGMRWDSNTSTLYLSLDGDGTYKSNNRGASWTLAFADSVLPSVRGVSPSDLTSGALVAETLAGLRKSTDGGVTWGGAGNTGLPGGWTTNLKTDNAGTIYASAADGVYKLIGTQWTKMPSLPSMMHGQVKVREATVYATTSNKGVYKFNASTNAWQAINTGLPTNLVGRNPKFVGDGASANNSYLGLYGDGVYYTSDAGANWAARNTGLSGNALFVNSMDFYGSLGYISTDAGVYKTTDGGLNWVLVFAPKNAANQTVPSGGVTADPLTNSTIYAGVFNTDALGAALSSSGVWKSLDAGATWTQLAGMAGKKVRDVRFVGTSNADQTLVAAVWEPGTAGGLFVSHDGGATWTRESTGLTTNLVNSAMATNTGGYVATRGAGLFTFTDSSVAGPNFEQLFIARNSGVGAENFGVGVSYPRTPNDGMASYAIACPGGKSASGSFGTAINSGGGHEWYNVNLGTTQPATPFDCTSTVTYANGGSNVATFTVDKFADAAAYPTAVSLAANADVSNFTSVSFTNPLAGLANTRVQSNLWPLNAAGYSTQQLWFVGDATSPMTYTGPALTPNTHYQLAVTTVEGSNVMHAAQYWIPFCYQCTGSGGSGTGSGAVVNVVSGWNLLGNSTSTAIDVATAFGTSNVTTVWKWVPATSKWAFYAPSMTAANLATYAANKQYDVLTSIAGGEGFWVNALNPFTVNLPNATAVSSGSFATTLGSGWSLISIGDNKTPRAFNNALSPTPPSAGTVAAPILTTLWAWDSGKSSWYFYAPSLDNSNGLAAYTFGKSYLDFGTTGTLAPGMGFWVNKP